MFENAYPDGVHTLAFVRRSLVIAAQKQCPAALSIHMRLLQDEEYISKITPVVSSTLNNPRTTKLTFLDLYSKPRGRIALIRGEVKDRSNAIVSPVFFSMSSTPEVVRFVEKQLSNYYYTFPKGPRVSCSYILVTI